MFDHSPIGLRRLYHQRISSSSFKDAAQVVAWLGAMQGQDYPGTRWAFGLRLPGSIESDIEQAIASRSIMRTWALRGTLHYVAPADIHWLVGLMAPRQIATNARRYKQLELDDATLARSTTLIAESLADGQHLTRSELFAILEVNGISTEGQRGFYMLQRAGLERCVFQGEMRGSETTFLALKADGILPKDEALARLALRYFTSHGPATLADFIAWSDLVMAEARQALESIRSQLVEEINDGQTCYFSPETREQPQHSVYVLPGFDEFVLGYRDRSAVLDPKFADAICPGGNGVFQPTIVSHGRIVGTWKRTIKKKTVEIKIETFRPLHDDEMAGLAEAAEAFGAFLNLKPVY